MYLSLYLTHLADRRMPNPDYLEVEPPLAAQLFALYPPTEERGRERGGPLIYDPTARAYSIDPIDEGGPESMNIPETDHPGNFGDVHAHPSASIGHAGGYSAHSMEDLKNFRKTVDKPFWIQFVVAGPWLYAMVQVPGVSKWDNSVTAFLDARTGIEFRQMTERLESWAGGRDKWQAKKDVLAEADGKAKAGVPLQSGPFVIESKNKARMGTLMQELSVRHCAEFAREYNFFFFAGEGPILTRMLSV